MKLRDIGYNDSLERHRADNGLTGFEVGRVVAEHKESYVVRTETGEFIAEVTGNLRYSAKGREDFPSVGDWVSLSVHDSEFALIHNVLPRSSVVYRRAVGQFGEKQIIATNIDYAFLVQAADRDFNVNRLERYLTICHASKVAPIIVLTKTDLRTQAEISEIVGAIGQRIEDVPVVPISNETRDGYEALRSLISPGKTYCMLGSSGVGKSTLLNNLSGKALMKTEAISKSTSKGRHVTTHRELIVLPDGGMIVDNPGMREVGIADSAQGLKTTFDKIFSLAQACRFQDCTHVNELGCAVLEAVAKGEIDPSLHESYLKIEREKAHFESSVAEKRKKDKSFGKMLKHYKKEISKSNRRAH